jgi:catechol 2,3-dioxygenase-like lactoylglutathione lyase family enzyme
MSIALSHITLITTDLDRMQNLLETILEARCIYASGQNTFSLSEERFFKVGDTWVAIMQGDALSQRSYNHIAFFVEDGALDACRQRVEALDLDLHPPRPRVKGEGRSVYFYSHDNHLIELHSGTLNERLARYAQTQGQADDRL